jgi:MYXO-CTERM domain-containing protein
LSELPFAAGWEIIFADDIGLGTDPGRLTPGPIVDVVNNVPYTSYRVLVSSQRGMANSVQYSEFQLFGTLVPEPSSFVLGAFGAVGLAALVIRRRRK